MPVIIATVREETLSGAVLAEFELGLPSEQTTIRELIHSQVYQKVKDLNAQQSNHQESHPRIELTTSEQTLNGQVNNNEKTIIDWQSEFERAVDAFNKQQILIFVNGCQMMSLDDQLEISPTIDISFVRLTLLMGG